MSDGQLRRELGLPGAITTGLGSILGTGVFVSIGIAAGVAGSYVVLAILLAAVVAICNGLSSAQLAANHPVSGGTYEYGHRWLTPTLGFVAGWLFLCAKSASAATAVLGLAGYISILLGSQDYWISLSLAVAILLSITIATLVGIKRTSYVNVAIVGTTVLALISFIAFGFPLAIQGAPELLTEILNIGETNASNLLHATALMFVAYTGYGRIATLGEEVRDPRKTIPRAVVATLLISMLLYSLVAVVCVGVLGAESLAQATKETSAPLLAVAQQIDSKSIIAVISIGAVTAMLGVILNLQLGLSRVALAMARRSDMPRSLATINRIGVPKNATIFVTVIVLLIVLIGDIKLAWSFSAFSVLVYYSLTNLCALRIKRENRVFPIWTAWCGLFSCLFLTVWIEPSIVIVGTGVVLAGLVFRFAFRSYFASEKNAADSEDSSKRQ